MSGLPGTPPSRNNTASIDASAVHEECDRILSDPLFKNSKRSSDLLTYIVGRTLDGRHECLKERIIGIEVLGRSPDYDTNQDASVRGAIADLRKRLTRYFEDPRHQQELKIELPAGTYVAEFTIPQEVVQEEEPTITKRSNQKLYLSSLVLVVIAAAFFWGLHFFSSSRPIDRFWSPMINSSGPVLISIGSPVAAPPRPAGTASGKPSETQETSLSRYISQQANFPMAELNAANSIESFLNKRGRPSMIKLASSTSLSDLHQGPVVLLGSYTNEWAMRLGSGLHFQFQRNENDRLHWIEDPLNPNDHSWAVNLDAPNDQVKNEYALVTRELDPTTGKWWIGVGGLSVLGTVAAPQTLLDPDAMAALSSQLPKNWDRKNLQIVLEIKLVNGSPGASRAVAVYSW
jgi:hypothetical protein